MKIFAHCPYVYIVYNIYHGLHERSKTGKSIRIPMRRAAGTSRRTAGVYVTSQ
jgi:hypothetical protein